MTQRISSRVTWLLDSLMLMIIIGCLYALWLGSYPLFTPDEGRYCEIAREMIVNHSYITPKIIGMPFLDKPILYYWFQALAISLFGVTEFALRFFPAAIGLLGCLMTYTAGRMVFSRRTGLTAALILATSPLYFIGAHYANLDLEVAVWLTGALLSLWVGFHRLEQNNKAGGFFLAAYLFAALAFLTKGMMGIVFPAAVTGIFLMLKWRWRWLQKMRIAWGILIFTALTLPWYVLAQQENPAFLHYFFVTQQVTRFLSQASFNNALPIWFYLPVLVLGFFPWSLFLISAWRSSKQHLFLIIWIAFIFLFFSIPHSKIITYLLPIFPATALLVADYFTKMTWVRGRSVLMILIIINATGLLFMTQHAHIFNQNSSKQLTQQLKVILKPQDQVVSYYRFFQDVPVYLDREIAVVANWKDPNIAVKDNWRRELWLGSQLQTEKHNLWSSQQLATAWHSKRRIYIFVSRNYLVQFLHQQKPSFLIGNTRELYLFSNHRLENPIFTDGKSKHRKNHQR